MRYEGMIYRPPSEAYSLIVQVTIGCSQNRCIFCSMFKEKRFRIRKVEEVLEDLQDARNTCIDSIQAFKSEYKYNFDNNNPSFYQRSIPRM